MIMFGNMDEEVLLYFLNETLEPERCVEVFRVMMEYEDYDYDWLLEQFLAMLERVDEYALTDKASTFVEGVRNLNLRKMNAATGETSEMEDDWNDEDGPNYDDDYDDYTSMY
jgi:hypothetical protein